MLYTEPVESKDRSDAVVLVADGDPLVRKAFTAMLCHSGFGVVAAAANGLDALSKAFELLPDVILVDVDLPGIGGLQVARVLDQMCPAPIVVTAEHDAFIRLAWADRPCMLACLLKPAGEREVQAAIARAEARFEGQTQRRLGLYVGADDSALRSFDSALWSTALTQVARGVGT